mmetsp:Transcript_101713/g.232905  ORF Transcript_101713/g.232905 Transcript_101713/m.232905 type:complete len:282 (+) Transcript_101713:649-1494(+)
MSMVYWVSQAKQSSIPTISCLPDRVALPRLFSSASVPDKSTAISLAPSEFDFTTLRVAHCVSWVANFTASEKVATKWAPQRLTLSLLGTMVLETTEEHSRTSFAAPRFPSSHKVPGLLAITLAGNTESFRLLYWRPRSTGPLYSVILLKSLPVGIPQTPQVDHSPHLHFTSGWTTSGTTHSKLQGSVSVRRLSHPAPAASPDFTSLPLLWIPKYCFFLAPSALAPLLQSSGPVTLSPLIMSVQALHSPHSPNSQDVPAAPIMHTVPSRMPDDGAPNKKHKT